MSNSRKAPVVSMSGSPIYRHAPEAAWKPAGGDESVEEIDAHVSEYLGEIESVFHEIVSDTVHIDVHFVKPTEASPVCRLVTSGMSDLPMTTPDDADVPRFVELMTTLPGDWQLDEESLKDENWYWPIHLLKFLARLPHKHSTWLGWGHSVPNGDPAQPYAPSTKLSGALILPSITVPEQFHVLTVNPQKTIHFFAVVPLYDEEMNLKLRSGTDELLDRFESANVSDVIDPGRRNVGRRRFGLF
ncbi:MAG: suppressor of fused domain protein [Gammaproteobacteria bacterium]